MAADTFRFVAAAVGVGVGVGVNVAVGEGVGVGVEVAVAVGVGVGAAAGRISIAMVPHWAVAVSEPVTDKAEGPPKVLGPRN